MRNVNESSYNIFSEENLGFSFSSYAPFYKKASSYLKEIYEAEDSYYKYASFAWPYVEGTKKFVGGWHLEAMAEHLQALCDRQIKRLIINIPPRFSKSTFCSVLLPSWRWIHFPEEQFLYISYDKKLSFRDSVKCRRLILSPWYQNRWGHLYQLEHDQNTKGRFDNNLTGYRLAGSVNSGITGEGGSIIILDDPNNVRDVESDAKREETIDFLSGVLPTRLNDPKKDCLIIVQQRTHHLDATGWTLANDINHEYVHLCLPMEFEEHRRCSTVILPSTHGQIWKDPRTIEGEFLCSERFGEKEVKRLKNALGSEFNIAGQLQQRPSPKGGGIIKSDWFRWWKEEDPPHILHTIQSWDTAAEPGKENSYSACTTWGIFKDEFDAYNLILLSMWRGKLPYHELRKVVQRLYEDYRSNGEIANVTPDGMHIPDIILVEAKSTGTVLIQDLILAGVPVIRFNPSKYGDKKGGSTNSKIFRAQMVAHYIEAGRIYMPAQPPHFKTLRPYADTVVENCATFPSGASRDLVDTLTQVLLRMKETGWITNPHDFPIEDQEIYTQNIDD